MTNVWRKVKNIATLPGCDAAVDGPSPPARAHLWLVMRLMNRSTSLLLIPGFILSLAGCAHRDHASNYAPGEATNHAPAQEVAAASAPEAHIPETELLDILRRIYPDTSAVDLGEGPYFHTIEEIARFTIDDRPHQILWIARGRVRQPDLLILDDAGRLVRRDTGAARHEIELIDGTGQSAGQGIWLRHHHHPLLRLGDRAQLEHLQHVGWGGILARLARDRTMQALETYRINGRTAFVNDAALNSHAGHTILELLPERIARAELYPMLVSDVRPSAAPSPTPWEATVLARLIPDDEAAAVTIVFIARAGSEGAHSSDIKLVIRDVHSAVPTDRPSR